jgi:hypothetical protein
MDIGIGLPATIPWTNAPLILEWAKRADSGPFSSLGILDRLVYPNYEPLPSSRWRLLRRLQSACV